jgi:hypothetical protein
MQGGFGLFEEGMVARALDRVQRPAVPRPRRRAYVGVVSSPF